ncbi:MAG: YkgJ family cysteine cluster protein [Polyangiales bacterium]
MTLDCRTCGACCHGDDTWVHVGLADEPRVPALGNLVILANGRRSLRMVSGRCAALTERDGLFTCSVYEDRPSPCREVMPGDRWCLAAREQLRS